VNKKSYTSPSLPKGAPKHKENSAIQPDTYKSATPLSNSNHDAGNDRQRARLEDHQISPAEAIRPFRLVKYFSLTGFTVIVVFILALTILISHEGKVMTQKKSEDYARLLSDNLNHQVFLQFLLPTAMRYGRIRLREPEQFALLDNVIHNTIHSFNVKRVNLYDLEGTITYSTDSDLVGTDGAPDNQPYNLALKGQHTSILITESGDSLIGLEKTWTLRTFYPFRAEERFKGPVGDVLGVFEIDLDLTEDYTEITKFQVISVTIALAFAGLIFFILRQIIIRGEKIIEDRNLERRRLEEKLHHSQRLAHLGQMIAAVAHEIRNPLGIISSTAEILENKVKKFDQDNKLAGIIVEEARRLNGIVTEFLDFARPQVPRPQTCRLVDVLESNINFLEPSLEKQGIEITRNYRAPDPIQADPDLLYRAFLNVFVNSIQAMPDGGKIRVSTYSPDGAGTGNMNHVEIAFVDSGTGIDPGQASDLFSPFFTTKKRGSGLGLTIVKNIIEGHKGMVSIAPNPEGGTRFIVRLPISQD
jgi:two-component system, NtrC family, sensor histidine kinase HydH